MNQKKTPEAGVEMTVWHTVGFSQYMGWAKFHLLEDCTYLTRKRTEAGWDRTGCNTQQTYSNVLERNLCALCRKRRNKQQPPA